MKTSCLDEARDLIGTYRFSAFSFDVFDTFLLRKCTGPDGVFERAYQLAPIPEGYEGLAESYVQNRMFAEQRARDKRKGKNLPPEVTIEEIYEHFSVQAYGLTNADKPKLVQAEFQAELDLCILNPDIYDVYLEARSIGLKTGFLSDTYWSTVQLTTLLKSKAPDLEFDFLYASCEHGYGKSAGMFEPYLKEQNLSPAKAAHIGDNEVADVKAPAALGISTVYYPQMAPGLSPFFKPEISAMQLIQSQTGGIDRRLDDGLRVMRRFIAANSDDFTDLPEIIGSTVFGPVMTGFQKFVEHRVNEIKGPGKKVSVLFLARDGVLAKKLWDKSDVGEAYYVEVNRRVALVGSSAGVEPLQDLFRMAVNVNENGVEGFLKAKIPAITKFFKQQEGQRASGKAFCEALPDLLTEQDLEKISGSVRKRLMEYLELTVPDFKDSTDVVLVDIGYSGTIQRALRDLFNQENLEHMNLHGVYFASFDNAFLNINGNDTFRGMIDSRVLPPLAMQAVLRNVAIIEQVCSAHVGSVVDYKGAEVVREVELRSEEQFAVTDRIQNGILSFYERYQKAAPRFGIDPLAWGRRAQSWCATIISRCLLLPLPPEIDLFGPLKHDVNLGSRQLADMVSMEKMQMFMNSMTLEQLFEVKNPPMWLAGNIFALSRVSGYLGAIAGFGLLQGNMLVDSAKPPVLVTLIKGNIPNIIPVSYTVSQFGEHRLRISVFAKDTGSVAAIPLENIAQYGVVNSITLQTGDNAKEAIESRDIESIPVSKLRFLQANFDGRCFSVNAPDANILLDIPATTKPVSIIIVNIKPLTAEARMEQAAVKQVLN